MAITVHPAARRRPSTSEQLGMGFSRAAELGSEYLLGEHQKREEEAIRNQEDEAISRVLGMDLRGIRGKSKEQILGSELTGRREQQNAERNFQNQMALQKNKFDLQSGLNSKQETENLLEDEANYEKIKNLFGDNFANVWRAAPTGGKTELLRAGIDAKLRGDDIDRLLQGVNSSTKPQETSSPQITQMKNGVVPKKHKWEDFATRPPGYTPKEWRSETASWRKENVPVFQENNNRLKSNIRDALDIKKLGQLNKSKKLPEGLERALINPETGELYGLAQLGGAATPETQEYAKIFARFQNRAKDAYGSRVTNFDLVQYMKQFPGLLNTSEGRDRILNMMKINNELDQSYEKALKEVYNHYGLSGIPQEKADELAQSFIRDETKRLEDEYLKLDEENMMQDSVKPQQLSGRMVDVIGPDGDIVGEIDESEVGELPEGYRIL